MTSNLSERESLEIVKQEFLILPIAVKLIVNSTVSICIYYDKKKHKGVKKNFDKKRQVQ